MRGPRKTRISTHSVLGPTIILRCLPLALTHHCPSPCSILQVLQSQCILRAFDTSTYLASGSLTTLPPGAPADPSILLASHLLYLAAMMISETNWILELSFGAVTLQTDATRIVHFQQL